MLDRRCRVNSKKQYGPHLTAHRDQVWWTTTLRRLYAGCSLCTTTHESCLKLDRLRRQLSRSSGPEADRLSDPCLALPLAHYWVLSRRGHENRDPPWMRPTGYAVRRPSRNSSSLPRPGSLKRLLHPLRSSPPGPSAAPAADRATRSRWAIAPTSSPPPSEGLAPRGGYAQPRPGRPPPSPTCP